MAGRIRICVSRAGSLSELDCEQGIKSLVAQRFHRVEPCGEVCGNERRNRADEECADTNDSDISWDDFRWDRRKLIDFTRENLDAQCRCQPVAELVAVTD